MIINIPIELSDNDLKVLCVYKGRTNESISLYDSRFAHCEIFNSLFMRGILENDDSLDWNARLTFLGKMIINQLP